MARPVLQACAVRVPCSTSNLGAGFDCLGLAFDRYLDAGFEPGDDALRVERAGTLGAGSVSDADDVLLRAFREELQRRGAGEPRGALAVTSAIPVGYGLGSSAAAVVAGIALAAAATGTRLDREAALATAIHHEGHPDNAAPALFGGLVAVVFTDHTPRALRLPLSPGIGWAFAAPATPVSTQRARAALPQQVPHSAAVRNTGRMAALLHGLASADAASLAAGFNDELHVPYRLPLIAEGRAALEAGVRAGAWAVTISGSGSGVLAACPLGRELAVMDALVVAFRRSGQNAGGFVLRPDAHGVQPRDIVTLRTSMRAGSTG
jgi:homoserine kinase